jgi:cytochrome P450
MTQRFVPPYPVPHRSKSSLLRRFFRGWHSWIHVLFDKSYTMKMGEIHTPAQSFYIVNELPLAGRIMDDAEGRYPKHRFLADMLDPLIGNSLFSANGRDWQEQRAMVTPAYSAAALKTVFPLMLAAADDLVARIAAMDLSRPVHIDPLMTHAAADIIYRTLFSQPLGAADAAEIHRAFHRYQRHAQSTAMLRLYRLPAFGFLGQARGAARRIHRVFGPVVAARFHAYHAGERGGEADILAQLLAARHPETGGPFTLDELMGQVATLFLAGHETAATAMTWALYLVAECPDLQEAARAEAAAAAPGGELGHPALRQLSTSRNIFREALRLYPPIGFYLREVTEGECMRDKALAPGAMLVVSPWLIQRNRDNFPDPHAFDPGRFDDPAQAAACRDAYLPFGRGPRFCIGAGFAQQEALILLVRLLATFRFAAAPGHVPEPVSRLTLRPRRGVWLMVARLAAEEAGG